MKKRSAFTLVEAVIVVMIMGILAAAAVPTFYDSLLFHRVESAARRVKADLELVRQTARLTSTAQTFAVSGMTYTASDDIADLDTPSQTYTVDLSKPPYSLTGLTADFNDESDVEFDGYGMPSSGGTVVVGISGHQCTVTLDGTTGQVTITNNHTRGRRAKVTGS